MSEISEQLSAADEKLADLRDDTASIADEIEDIIEDHAEVSLECDPTELTFTATVEYDDVIKLLNEELPDDFIATTKNGQLVIEQLLLDYDFGEGPSGKRGYIKNLKQLIADIEQQYEEGAPVDKVIGYATKAGMDSSKVEHEIDKLKQKGEVYEPATDYLRTT